MKDIVKTVLILLKKRVYVVIAVICISQVSCKPNPEKIDNWQEREEYIIRATDNEEYEVVNKWLQQWLEEDLTAWQYDFPLLQEKYGFSKAISSDENFCIFSWYTHNNSYPDEIWKNLILYKNEGKNHILVNHELGGVDENNKVISANEWGCKVPIIRQVKDLNGRKIYLTEKITWTGPWVTSSIEAYTIKDDNLYKIQGMFLTSDGRVEDEIYCGYNNSDWYFIKNRYIKSNTVFQYNEDEYEIHRPIDNNSNIPLDRYERLVFNGSKFVYTDIVPNEKLHLSLHEYRNIVSLFLTEKHLIRIDEMQDGSYRYAAWKQKDISLENLSMQEKPDLTLYNGSLDDGDRFIFRIGSYEYRIYMYGDEHLLEICQHGDIIHIEKKYVE